MPLPSSGIIVVEKPSSSSNSNTRITNPTTTETAINTVNSSSLHLSLQKQTTLQRQQENKQQIQYYECYDVNENCQLSTQEQKKQHQQQQQKRKNSSLVVGGGTLCYQQTQQQQQQIQLGGSGVVIARRNHNLSSPTSSSSASFTSISTSSSFSCFNKKNLQRQNFKTVPMPQQIKQNPQQQHIIQHTSHTPITNTTSNSQHHHQQLHQLQQQQQQTQHVQQINLAAPSSIHHQTQHHTQQQQQTTQHQQPSQTTHMIQVSEEFLEQAAANNRNTGKMMISTTGEVINQQQVFKIVSTDGTTGNMIIDTTANQNATNITTNSKVLLSNLTVLSKQQTAQATAAQGQIIGGSNHQQTQAVGTASFVNAKNLYSTSSSGHVVAGGGAGCKQQKFTVTTANVGNYKGSGLKQTSNCQFIQQTNQKINMSGSGSRNVQMLATTRVQNVVGNAVTSANNIGVITNNTATAQTMILQQQQKFIANNTIASGKSITTLGSSGGGGNIIKKSTSGTLRMNNSNSPAATATKLMNNLQTNQGVKTFITQTACVQQQQTTQNINQLTLQHHNTSKGSGKSKFVKQYNNAILNSAGAVTIATLPHQLSNSQNNFQQLQHVQQPQTTYISHHKGSSGIGSGSTKINKISSKYAAQSAASVPAAAQLPPGTQLHQKSTNQTQQQQTCQTTSNSNIKFVNAQGTIIQQQQQQPLNHQKTSYKHQQHHQQQHINQQSQYQSIQNFDSVDGGNHAYSQQQTAKSTTTSIPNVGATTGSTSLLTDDVMMVNGTQMTEEISARILQSMSQKSFNNQRFHQQQQHVYQTKVSPLSPSTTSNSNTNSNSTINGSNMLPPPILSSQQQPQQNPLQIQNNSNNTNIILSPREYTLYTTTATTNATITAAGQQQQSPNHHYNNSAASPSATAVPSNITSGSSSFSSNYLTISGSSNNLSNISHLTPLVIANSANNASCITTTRQAQSAPSSRSQSMERKLHESSISRKSTEYYKANNHNSVRGNQSNLTSTTAVAVQGGIISTNISNSSSNLLSISPTTCTPLSPSPRPSSIPPPPSALIMEPQAQVIHLQATKALPGANNSSNDDDDDIIGEEVRPVPVETNDVRLRILHAVLFDHTYVNPMPSELPTTFAVQQPLSSNASSMGAASSSVNVAGSGHGQQWSLGGIGAVTATGNASVAVQQNYPIFASQLSRLQQDDDSYSGISSSSRLAIGEIDPGEETETAPEAELEDDSITRCICDLTHDDGYMICCDKCCAWQHVDCMGIDRQNIPDEYLCELCQPRVVDKARARSLQLMKRKEQQQQQLLLTAQAQAAVSSNTMGAAGSTSGSGNITGVANLLSNEVLAGQKRLMSSTGRGGFTLAGNMPTDPSALQLLATNTSNIKKGKILKKVKDSVAGKRSKKAEKLAAVAAAGLSSGKPARKETKKNIKRKKAGAHEGISTVGMTAAEKHAANLRQWIENYELAVTNHYSPELRARLHAITKQHCLLQSILNTENPILKQFSNGSLENQATTVPHAGGKILISNLDITPNSPICELRGKYMLTTQYKTQNTSMNMNCPPPSNYHLGSYKAHKTPGPFIFFYQLPGSEVKSSSPHATSQTTTTTTTTLNPDGTYITTTTTLPAPQSPPTFLKGPEICVDTRTYGNEARFVRRSCRPNAEIQHLFEKGTIHLFIVALTDIRASTEITIRHEPHDLLAVENKKSSSMIIQPTSTPCACGLTKDCIFGPPLPQLTPAAKSNTGRKSYVHSAGSGTGNTGNLTVKQRKANQQNMNRNRSVSSSASGDSNMGAASTATTAAAVAIGLNSPNNLGKIGGSAAAMANKTNNSNITLLPLTASCNSNLSNASSTSSTLTSMMHDSGICTSSSSPSVSIPSPTQHNMHSPIQQQTQQGLQSQQQLLNNTTAQVKANQLLPQQQQLMQSLPTPLILTTNDMPQQQQQHLSGVQQNATINVKSIAVASPSNSTTMDANVVEQQQKQQHSASLCLSTQQHSMQLQQLMSSTDASSQKPIQLQQALPNSAASISGRDAGQLDTISAEASIAAIALQSLNSSDSPKITVNTSTVESQIKSDRRLMQQQLQQQSLQQGQCLLITDDVISASDNNQQIQGQKHNQTLSDNTLVKASVPSCTSSSQLHQQSQQQQQQPKSPQKNNNTNQSNPAPHARKTPAKHSGGRSTSFSEDNEHNANEDIVAPKLSSTPNEKPKLSREDRKMEAILRAIEKMERNQQRKQEQKQAKRQNSNSHNTTPTSPNKSLEGCENSGGSITKRSNNQSSGRSKKKRKAGNKGQGGNSSNQRKRRQSRINSQESLDECGGGTHDNDTVTSESDGCTVMHSPPTQTMATVGPANYAIQLDSNTLNSSVSKLPNDIISNNVDQAAGLLMAFANPTATSNNTSTSSTIEQDVPQSPIRPTSHYAEAVSPPPTPPSQVSSACLLIEAAVGPLENNLNNSEIHNTEFKYPPQAKTKKQLMNNWLHQAEEEDNSSDNKSDTQTTCIAGVSGGLDSLLQAAMSDLKQSQTQMVTVVKSEEPQNLSIAAQKVEEFIQQTEASSIGSPTPTPHPQSPPSTKHSLEYKQNPYSEQETGTYVDMSSPAIDLTIKSSVTAPSNSASQVDMGNNSSRNFHLPLQVSTCSNNSSVKKRWLRQAISEESSHEEFQQNFSMTPSPTTATATSFNSFVNSHPQIVATCSSATTSIHVPNGFTTPLKKRRLLLTGKDEIEENLEQSSGDFSSVNTPLSPSPLVSQDQQQQLEVCETNMPSPPIKQNQHSLEELENKEVVMLSHAHIPQDVLEDVDIDVEKCELNDDNQMQKNQIRAQIQSHNILQEEIKYSKFRMDQEQDVDVITSPKDEDDLSPLKDQIKIETVIKNEESERPKTAKERSPARSVPTEFNDQEDDVDILRSPSPGREMIKAEDNLVKIEPEDTSGTEDVKIDVEREEESMTADDDVVTLHKEKNDVGDIPQLVEENNVEMHITMENVELKQEIKLESCKDEDELVQVEKKLPREDDILENLNLEDGNVKLSLKREDIVDSEDEEPKPKIPKLDNTALLSCVKEQILEEVTNFKEKNVKEEIKIKSEGLQSKQHPNIELVVPHSTTSSSINSEFIIPYKSESPMKEKLSGVNSAAEVTSSTSSTLMAVKTVAADSTFADAATPPPPVVSSAPIQHKKSLSDDDIQARLHNFHKENILFLQSRNKKSKSSTSTHNHTTTTSSSSTSFSNSSDNHKSRTSSSSSSSSSSNHHHHHHHHHDAKDRSDKSSSKHHKNLSATIASGRSSKKQKLHKHERTSATSSSSSHKNSIASEISTSVPSFTSTSSSGLSASKKIKSLKKSSSISSALSNSSLPSSSLTSNLIHHQNCYPSSTFGTTISPNVATSEKEKALDKEKQHSRQRTCSSSSLNSNNTNNNNAVSSNAHTTPTTATTYPVSKKRQLNFELELTKDLHLLNNTASNGSGGGSGKHKRVADSRLTTDDHSNLTKKPKKDTIIINTATTTSSHRGDESKNGTNKQFIKMEKLHDKKILISAANSSTKCSIITTAASNTATLSLLTTAPAVTVTTTVATQIEEPKPIPTIVTHPPMQSNSVLREHHHHMLPHFHSSAISTSSNLAVQQTTPPPLSSVFTSSLQVQPQIPPVPVVPQNIPIHMNISSSFLTSSSNPNINNQQQHPPPTPPPCGISSTISTNHNVNTTNHLPFYNTIYGKLLDNPTLTPIASNTLTSSTTPPITSSVNDPSAGGVLSEYLDTKLKSYSTLGGYVSHTALFGLNNTHPSKDSPSSSVVSTTVVQTVTSSITAITTSIKDYSSEMPAPVAPPPNSNSSSTTPLKIHTKTASHDPRLNPQLSAPEPPPQPKRKLSINEYRKRMQQSSSNDSSSNSNNLTTTQTTPPISDTSSTMVANSILTTTTMNKCTLNSPDHLTQSVDSQIQKEIMSSTSEVAATSSSPFESHNSSNSSISSNSLNDSLLKSSSFVEEDSTKGQFNAAPTLLEKQQESLCARLKSLKEKQSLSAAFTVGSSGNRSRFSSFSESIASNDFGFRKDDDDILRNRNHSISSSIGGGDLLDNCLEEISSTSTSMSSSREPSPERYSTNQHRVLTASATTTMTTTSSTSHKNNGQNAARHQEQINCDKNDTVSIAGLDRKKSLDIA